MKRRIRNILWLIVAIICLQKGTSWLNANLPILREQQQLILDEGMDPSLLFYTESEHALRAEKQVRQKIRTATD